MTSYLYKQKTSLVNPTNNCVIDGGDAYVNSLIFVKTAKYRNRLHECGVVILVLGSLLQLRLWTQPKRKAHFVEI